MPTPIRDLRIRLYDPRHDAFLRYEASRRNVPESIIVRDALEVACAVWEYKEERKHGRRIDEASTRSRVLERTTTPSARLKREDIDLEVAGVLQPPPRRSLDTPQEIRELLTPADTTTPALLPAAKGGAS